MPVVTYLILYVFSEKSPDQTIDCFLIQSYFSYIQYFDIILQVLLQLSLLNLNKSLWNINNVTTRFSKLQLNYGLVKN